MLMEQVILEELELGARPCELHIAPPQKLSAFLPGFLWARNSPSPYAA